MESGIKVPQETIQAFNQMKLKKACKYMILGISGDVVTVSGQGSGDVEELYASLPKDDCAFVLYDTGRCAPPMCSNVQAATSCSSCTLPLAPLLTLVPSTRRLNKQLRRRLRDQRYTSIL